MARNKSKEEQFVDRIVEIFDLSTPAAREMVSIHQKQSIRINPLKVNDPQSVLDQFNQEGVELSKIPWCEHCYVIESPKYEVTQHDLFQQGYVHIQNASSFIPPLVMDPQPDELILDMCAAPGGKASHMAALTNNDCGLYTNDISADRNMTMRAIFHTLSVETEAVYCSPAERLFEDLDQQFDKILLDAQCSGEGRVNLNHRNALKYWNLKKVEQFQWTQRKMIKSAYKLLKPGGRLVYTTCTFSPEENELVIDYALRLFDDLEIVPISLDIPNRMPGLTLWQGTDLNPSLENAMRIIPNDYMEHFFIAMLEKKGTE